MTDFTKRRIEQAIRRDEHGRNHIDSYYLYELAMEVGAQAMAQMVGWTADLELMPEPLAGQACAQITLKLSSSHFANCVATLLDMAQSSNPDFSGPGSRGLAKLIIAEGKSPNPVECPSVYELMEGARELMHGGPELATVREEVRVEEARQRMRGPTDAQR